MSEVKKGLTVVVRADTSEFRREMKRARKSVKKLSKELREADRLIAGLESGGCRGSGGSQ